MINVKNSEAWGITRWRLLHQNIHSRYCYKICKNLLQIVGIYTYMFQISFDALHFICVYYLLSMNLVLQKYLCIRWTPLCVQCSVIVSPFWLITLYSVYFILYFDLAVCMNMTHHFDAFFYSYVHFPIICQLWILRRSFFSFSLLQLTVSTVNCYWMETMYSPLKRLDCKLLLDGNNVQSSQVSLDQLLLDGNYCHSGIPGTSIN